MNCVFFQVHGFGNVFVIELLGELCHFFCPFSFRLDLVVPGECGFFVWDTCVTVANVQKFLYFASALAGTIGFQTGALQLT